MKADDVTYVVSLIAGSDIAVLLDAQARRNRIRSCGREGRRETDAGGIEAIDVTPFRGLHADTGTVFELGYMCGQGKAAFAYSNVKANHYQRIVEYYGGKIVTGADGRQRGPDGLSVEDFDMNENLMLDGGITSALQEDILTHATPAAWKALAIADNLETILSIELLAASQAYDLQPRGRAARTDALYRRIRSEIPTYADDRPLNGDFARMRTLIEGGTP